MISIEAYYQIEVSFLVKHLQNEEKTNFALVIVINNSRGINFTMLSFECIWVTVDIAWFYRECTTKLKFYFLFHSWKQKQKQNKQFEIPFPIAHLKNEKTGFPLIIEI